MTVREVALNDRKMIARYFVNEIAVGIRKPNIDLIER
jgi:hypothetical protein